MRTTRPPSPPPPPPKRTRFGHYTLLERIAVGGMAEVFRAEEPRTAGEARIVVVKRMLPTLAEDGMARAMFKEEARLASRIHDKNVVEMFSEGEEDGRPYLVMEYVRGVNLSQLQHYTKTHSIQLEPEIAIYIVSELLRGLQAVHSASDETGKALDIVHYDISPSNILLSVHGDVKLGDFGIARTKLRKEFPQAPLNESARGKLGYLAPEQVRGEIADRRCDLFAAATIAAELLMGRSLFSAGTELGVLLAIRDAQIHPFLEFATKIPEELTQPIIQGLHKDPRARYQHAKDFRQALLAGIKSPADLLRDRLSDITGDARASRESRVTLDLPTPPAPHSADAPSYADTTPMTFELESGVQTHDVPILRYRVRTEDGIDFGPWTYAEMVEAIATGRISASDEVDVGRGTYRPIEMVPDLARHIARHLPGGEDSKTPITKRLTTTAKPDANYSLAGGGIIPILGHAALDKQSGLLLCELGSVRKEIYLRDGIPEYVSSNLAGELLGEYLVGKQVISRGELDMALAVMPRFEGRLGETLAALGLVEPVQLFQHIAEQVREKLIDLFSWESGTCSYYSDVEAPPSGFPLGLDAWGVLLEGIARRLEQKLDTTLEDTRGSALVVPHPEVLQKLAQSQFPHQLQLVLHALDRSRPLSELTRLVGRYSGESPVDPRAPLILLIHLGGISLQGPDAG
ncbi:MAG: protein kinase [Myxococcales bacterium]|nr:MAG: protein kinase [Myxococcales bacterium]